MTANCSTHYSMFTLSYVSDMNINSTLFKNIFKRQHHQMHQTFRTSLLFLQITPAKIYLLYQSEIPLNSLDLNQQFPPLLHDFRTYTVLTVRSRSFSTGSQLVKKFSAFYKIRRFITVFTKAHHMLLYRTLLRYCRQKWEIFGFNN